MTHDAWQTAIKDILKNGETYTDTDNRRCIEQRNQSITIDEDTAVDKPYQAMQNHDNWIYPTKQQLINVIFNADDLAGLDYTYGSRLLNFNNAINQLNDYVIPLLQDKPATRRAIAQLYDPQQDSKRRTSTPGIIYLDFLIRNNNLHCTACLRSNDVFFGYPANIIQINHVHQWVADQVDADQATITTISNSAHIFHDALQDINDVLNLAEHTKPHL